MRRGPLVIFRGSREGRGAAECRRPEGQLEEGWARGQHEKQLAEKEAGEQTAAAANAGSAGMRPTIKVHTAPFAICMKP
jgi:hypothetical protein